MARIIRVTRYKNCRSVIETYNDTTFIMKLLIAKKTFEKILGCGSGNNGKSINTDLF